MVSLWKKSLCYTIAFLPSSEMLLACFPVNISVHRSRTCLKTSFMIFYNSLFASSHQLSYASWTDYSHICNSLYTHYSFVKFIVSQVTWSDSLTIVMYYTHFTGKHSVRHSFTVLSLKYCRQFFSCRCW